MVKSLKLVAIVLLLGWFIAFIYALMNFAKGTADSTVMWWYATIAMSNNFAFAALVVVPFLLLFAPAGLLAEWLFEKGERIQERAESEAKSRRDAAYLAQHLPPQPAPLSDEELEELKEKTRKGAERTAAHLAEYFGPDGPSKPKPRTRGTRTQRRRRY
ncbi:hypothetical protein ACFHWW_26775 [Ensifer sp. P24N7]|uniref:hypothetical protein n=1 Tax=Sinorhizobium sp. P24N7 TaxID=3348358 RepID=UPI0035F30C80